MQEDSNKNLKDWNKSRETNYPYPIIITFDSGETRLQQEQWLVDSLSQVGLSKIDISYCWDRSCYCWVAFKDFQDFAKFRLSALGDAKRGHSLVTDCVVAFDDKIDLRWMQAANLFCDAVKSGPDADLRPNIEVSGQRVIFQFPYFSALARFRLAVENGEIDALANADEPKNSLRGEKTEARSKPRLESYGAYPR